MAIIAITQHIGTRADELGRLVADRLGYRFLNSQMVIDEAARRFKVTPEQLVIVDERRTHFWERLKTDTARFIPLFRAATLKFMAADNLVILGRSVAILLPEVGLGLRVRLVAPMKERIAAVAAEEKLAPAVAERRVREYDREVRARMQTLFNVDIEDPLTHHLTLNTHATPRSALLKMLSEAATEIDRSAPADSRQKLCDEALAAEVRATLMSHPKIGHAPLEVNCLSGKVQVNGPGLVPPWDDLIGSVARNVEGVSAVEVNAEESAAPVRPA
jgi:cytidylate kinase